MGKIRPKDLENGVAQPGANYYYGTNSQGQIGFHQVPWASESSGEADYVYGENISAGKLVFFGDGTFKERYKKGLDIYDTNNAKSAVNLGSAADTMKYRIQFDMPKETPYLSSVILPINKQGTAHAAANTVYGRIVTLGGDLVKESNKAKGNSFTAGHIVLDFGNIKLEDDSYRLEIVGSTTDSTNYYKIRITSDGTNAVGSDLVKYGYWKFDGSVWQNINNYSAVFLQMNFSIPTESGKVYECNSDMLDTAIPDGVTLETKIKGETGKVMIVGVSTSFDGLVTGLRYKLNSDVMSGHRQSTTTIDFNKSAAYNKVAEIFTCNFSHSISKLFLYALCTSNTISGSLVAKIVELDETTGMPSETLVNENAMVSVPYADLVNNITQAVVLKFPGEFSLTPNKKYALVLEGDGTISSTGYMTVRYDGTNGNGSLYRLNAGNWTQVSATSSLQYSFLHGDDIGKFQLNFLPKNNTFTNVGASANIQQACRLVVSVPTKIRELTWLGKDTGTPVTDMKVRIETNRVLTSATNSVGIKYDGTGGSAYTADFGSTAQKKVAMKFTPSDDVVVKYLTLSLTKTSSPSERVTVRIETDDNGKPSGTLVSESASTTADQSLQVTQDTAYNAMFRFDENISLSKNTGYWIVVQKENEAVSATSFYKVNCQNGGTFTGGSLYVTANGTTWEAAETGNVKMKFYFNNSNNVSMDVPSGDLVSEGATATFSASGTSTTLSFRTVQFDQEVDLIPNTIYWLVFENFRPIADSNYYALCSCISGWPLTNRDMLMPYLQVTLNGICQWAAVETYPRFRLDGERSDNGGAIDLEGGTFAGKEVTAISPIAGALSTGNVGNIYRGTLQATSNIVGSEFVFKAPRDGQITLLTDLAWTVNVYTYGGNYTALSTLTGSTAASINIEKGKLYHIKNGGSSVQNFILSLQ